MPTGKGPTAPGLEQRQASSLSPTARAALDGIPPAAANALATIATSSDYGAPTTSGRIPATPDGFSSAGGTSLGRTVDAAASAASPISDTDLIGLLLTLLVVTGGGAALAVQARGAR